jgi:hypothetical protein
MNNDLSRITDEMSEEDLPYLIYYPAWASPTTLEELARRKPSMKPQVARACIVQDCQDSYDRIKAEPDRYLVVEARASPNPYYLSDLLQRASELGIDLDFQDDDEEEWKMQSPEYRVEETTTHRPMHISWFHKDYSQELLDRRDGMSGIYEGISADISAINLYVCASESINRSRTVVVDNYSEARRHSQGNNTSPVVDV